jgi:hypothetical protein
MKVALMLSGLVRTLEQTWPMIAAQFKGHDLDTYVYLNEPAKEDLVRRLVSPRLLVAEPDPQLPEYNYATRQATGVNSIQNDLRQLHSMMRVNQLRRTTGIAYDWVVRCRPDLKVLVPLEALESFRPLQIYIPKFANSFGYNDRFAIGPPHLMDVYMERYPAFDAFFRRGGTFHMESFLAYHLRLHQVPVARTNFQFSLLRLDGSEVAPDWAVCFGDVK